MAFSRLLVQDAIATAGRVNRGETRAEGKFLVFAKAISVKAIPLSVIVFMGLAAPAPAAPPADAAAGTLRPHAIQISQNNLPNQGRVSEVIAAGKYSYLHVMNEGKGTWLAIPHREIAVGAKIRYAQGMAMKSFHSKTLKRTFDVVFFLGGVEVVADTSSPGDSGGPPVPGRQPGHVELPNSGRVSEVIAVGKYSYLHVMNEGKGTWLAIPHREIPVGAKIRYGEGAAMKSFHSKTLKRTFDVVYFLGGVAVVGE